MTAASAANTVLPFSNTTMKPKVKAAKIKLPALTKPSKVEPRKGKPRGFAAMTKEATRRIASMGGTAVMSRRGWAAKIGKIGGANSHKLTNGRKARAEA